VGHERVSSGNSLLLAEAALCNSKFSQWHSFEPEARLNHNWTMANKEMLNLSPEREAALLAATVGTAQELNGPIVLVPYQACWPIAYRMLEERLRTELGSCALVVEHVGSTAVPGLSAKAIVDIVLTVADSANEPSYLPALHRLGYELRLREPEWHEHRMLRLSEPRVHLHVFSDECAEVTKMIRFRNHLRECTEDRLLYERTKIALALQTWKYTQAYADAKTGVISTILKRAISSDRSSA
jgi:GrpB-like predicted nucleotidyltransferase (UPF0157 family)